MTGRLIIASRVTCGRGGLLNRMAETLPTYQECSKGVLVPLSDYGRDGADIHYKAWVCANPECGFHIRIDNGVLSTGKEVKESHK